MSTPSVRRSSRLSSKVRRSYVDAAPLTKAEINAFVRPIKAAMEHFETLKDVWGQYTQLLAIGDIIMQFPDQCAYYPTWRAAALETFWRNSTSLSCNTAMKRALLRIRRQLYLFFRSLKELPTWRPAAALPILGVPYLATAPPK